MVARSCGASSTAGSGAASAARREPAEEPAEEREPALDAGPEVEPELEEGFRLVGEEHLAFWARAYAYLAKLVRKKVFW